MDPCRQHDCRRDRDRGIEVLLLVIRMHVDGSAGGGARAVDLHYDACRMMLAGLACLGFFGVLSQASKRVSSA